jgi:hypothetical protein
VKQVLLDHPLVGPSIVTTHHASGEGKALSLIKGGAWTKIHVLASRIQDVG